MKRFIAIILLAILPYQNPTITTSRNTPKKNGPLVTKTIFTPDIALGIKQSLFKIGDAINIIDGKINGLGPKTCVPGPPYAISTPGSYILCSNIAGPVDITADNVSLDLNGHTISLESSGSYAMKITGSHVHVHSGFFKAKPSNFQTGISIEKTNNVKIENIQIDAFETGIASRYDNAGCIIQNCIIQCAQGMWFPGIKNFLIQNCLLKGIPSFTGGWAHQIFFGGAKGCTIKSCVIQDGDAGAYIANGTTDCAFENLTITNCKNIGLYLDGSSNSFYKCNISNIAGDPSGENNYGILVLRNSHNIFEECIINNVQCQTSGKFAAGISFEGSPNNKIINCKVEGIRGTSNAFTYGLLATFDPRTPSHNPSPNNTLKNNLINDISSDNSAACGICVNAHHTTVESNTIQNITGDAATQGILATDQNTSIVNNTISNVQCSNNAAFGIQTTKNHTTMKNNIIANITGKDSNPVTPAGATGIYCDTNSSHNIIKTNCINNINNQTPSSDKEYGIFINTASDHNIINDNEIESSYFGLKITGTFNLVLGNSANNNTTAYDGPGITSQDANIDLSQNYKINYYFVP